MKKKNVFVVLTLLTFMLRMSCATSMAGGTTQSVNDAVAATALAAKPVVHPPAPASSAKRSAAPSVSNIKAAPRKRQKTDECDAKASASSKRRSTYKHSREEIEFVARFLRSVEPETHLITPDAVVDALLLGDLTDAWDAIYTASHGMTYYIDYDGSFYHNLNRLPRDVSKTKALFEDVPDSVRDKRVVVRARPDGCAAWPHSEFADESVYGRLVIAFGPEKDIPLLVRTAVLAARKIDACTNANASPEAALNWGADLFVMRVETIFSKKWDAAMDAFADSVPDETTRMKILASVHGSISRVHSQPWRNGVAFLLAKLGGDMSSLVTLLNDCLCARLEAPGYVEALDRLASKPGVGWASMKTLINGCLCARLEAPGYVDALDRLASKPGVGWASMKTLLDGCLCSRLEAPGYVEALDRLASKPGVGWANMKTLLDGCLCSRLEAPGYVDALDRLASKPGVGWASMKTLINNCLCKRLEAPGYVDALDRLASKPGVGWASMKTLLDGCLCARLEAPGYVEALEKLSRITGGWEFMKTCCQGQVACRLLDPVYMASIEYLFGLEERVKNKSVKKPLIRSLFLGKNPFAPRLIAARAAFEALETADSKVALMMSMRGNYKKRSECVSSLGWKESSAVM